MIRQVESCTHPFSPGNPQPATVSRAAARPLGQAVILTATVSGAGQKPTGTGTFYHGSTALGTATLVEDLTDMPGLSGASATFTTAGLGIATHSLSAVYSGDSNSRKEIRRVDL